MAILLALGAALSYGVSDFVAGLSARRAGFVPVALAAQVTGAAVVVAALAATTRSLPGVPPVAWGAVSGLGGGLGTLFLYRGFARGRVGVVAPLSALGTAVIPVVVGVGLGDRPSAPALAGIACALPAVWLVSRSPEPGAGAPRVRGVADGLLAGVGFALLLIALQRGGTGHGLWPVAAGQVAGVVVLGTVALVHPGPLSLDRAAGAGSVIAGLLAAGAVVCYLAATGVGLLSLVAVITSLYPGSTVLLARVVLHEKMGTGQRAGLVLAGVAIVLIVA
ncbi:MAG TPA: EamA family transporter [Acidimicrobiales bacterium]|nr:EamA family transporter [Acidimicrobiales bacterium]